MTREPVRVALVMDHPAQHFALGLQLLADEPDVRVHVYYWSVARQVNDADFDRSISWDMDLLGGYTSEAPPAGRSVSGRVRWFVGQLRRTRPDVLICYGWASAIARTSIIYCLLTHTRLLLYGDSTWQHSSRGRHPVLRSVVLRLLMRLCAGAVSTGPFNREFYIWHGMDPRRIWPGVCPADTESFGRARAGDAEVSRVKDQPLRIGFAGKLITRKGADELLRATALLPRAYDWSVTVVGAGPLMPELRALAAHLGLLDRVTFHGFANTSEMPKLLAGFDVVVVPSRLDMRALITIEAMAAGAVAVVSDATAVWGAGDLVEHGVSGLVYPSGDPAALARELRRLLADQALLARLGSKGAERVAGYGPDAFARTMASAALRCLSATAPGVKVGRGRKPAHDGRSPGSPPRQPIQ
jgi:glycosyltransferase involved in cell wall biosynthesis